MKRLIKITVALIAFGAMSTQAQELRSDHPDRYTVQKGDTLWDISGMFLRDPWLWPEIWHANQQVANPHLIFPGDVLRLIYVDGQPRIVLDRGTVRLSPTIRSIRHEDAISAIPLDDVKEFFTKNRVVSQDELDAAPYMIAGPETRILVATGDRLYARGEFPAETQLYQVYKPGDEYIDPETENVLGVRAEATGLARFQSTKGEIGTMRLEESYKEVSIGDVFLPLAQDSFDSTLFPSIPGRAVDGSIIAVEGGVNNAGQFDVVAINLGNTDGMKVGDLLGILIKGETVRDRIANDKVELPDEQAGLLMVFQVFDDMAFGLVLESERALQVGYKVTSQF